MVIKQSTLKLLTNGDIPNISIKWWPKSTLTYILKMLMLSSHIYVACRR